MFKYVHLDCSRHDHKQVHQTVALGSFPLRGKTQICFVTGSPNKRWELLSNEINSKKKTFQYNKNKSVFFREPHNKHKFVHKQSK